MVSDSWEILQEYVLKCQEQGETQMEAQMSILLVPHMIFQLGLVKSKHGGKIPIGSH